MRVCIYGAGAIGGYIGASLAQAGAARVSAVARGATLQALRARGWRLRSSQSERQVAVSATDDPGTLGVQDLVVVAVKGPAMAEVARRIAPLLGRDTIVLPAMNGVPWWFGSDLPALGSEPLASVDPGGVIARAIPLKHVIGCVVHIAAASPEPGLVEHKMGRGLIIGEPDGSDSARLRSVSGLLSDADFEMTISPRIRNDIWFKLWGNLTTNPVSALTGATADRIVDDALVRAFCVAAMSEAAAIGARIGCEVKQTPEERHALTRKLGAFKTSMLQDVEVGRPLELDAIVGAVREIGQRVGIATPNIDALFGLTRLFARVQGLYPEASGRTAAA